jgi:hypothetical protein
MASTHRMRLQTGSAIYVMYQDIGNELLGRYAPSAVTPPFCR